MKHIFPFLFPFLACSQPSTVIISGTIQTQSGLPMPATELVLSGDEYATTTTDAAGQYSFGVQPGQYTVTPINRCPKLHGLDTADAKRVQLFLVNLADFDNVCQWLAADMNNSAYVSTVDAACIMQGLLLNPAADYTLIDQNGVSWWSFIPADWTHPQYNTFIVPAYPQSVSAYVGQDTVVDFTGFRKGDTNGSALPE